MGSPNPIDNCVASDNSCPGRVGMLPKCNSTVYTFGGGPGTIMSEQGAMVCWQRPAVHALLLR